LATIRIIEQLVPICLNTHAFNRFCPIRVLQVGYVLTMQYGTKSNG
jgi:hypothetical protein